jgi:hypothetical protein
MDQKPPHPAEETTAPPSDEAKPSLFPVFPVTKSSLQITTSPLPQWLSNSSFTTDIAVINDDVASLLNRETVQSPPPDDDENSDENRPKEKSYAILESSESDGNGMEREKKRKKKKRKRDRSDERSGFGSRKSRVQAWADSEANTVKDYYFDSHGDRDNLAFGCIYRYIGIG